jgi:uncharacterized membrane protein YeaQ/YmgE (transglycosylase-associated protein family)
MAFLAWILLGVVAGIVARAPIRRSGRDLLIDVTLGVIGAVSGGWLSNTPRGPGVTLLTLGNLVLALLGSVVILVFYHSVVRRRVTKVH